MSISFKKQITLILLLAILIVPFASLPSPVQTTPRAEAASLDLGELGTGFVAGAAACAIVITVLKYVGDEIAIAGVPVPDSEGSSSLKKFIDCVLYHVVNTLIEDMMKSVTKWAQGGFKGNPVFTTQWSRYMLNVADDVAGKYIEQRGLGFICSPFKAEIQLALTYSYRNRTRDYGVCTLSGVVENIDTFLNGDFYAGGWDGWIDLVSNPYSNPYGSYLESAVGLQIKLANARGEESQDLLQGRGFMSKKVQDCYATMADGTTVPAPIDQPAPTGSVDRFCDEPRVVTPGSFAQEQIGEQLGLSADRLTFADEMNEMITAIIAYLIRDVLVGDKGLAGYDPADFATSTVYPTFPTSGPIIIPDGPPGSGGTCNPKPWEIWANSPDAKPANRVEHVTAQEFVATEAEPGRRFDIDVPAKLLYTRMHAEFDLITDADPYDDGPVQYNVFWLHRSPNKTIWHANDVSEVVASKLGGNNLRFSTSINLNTGCAAQQSRGDRGFALQGNTTYHVTIDYNTKTRTRTVFIDGPGSNDGWVQDSTTVDALQSSNPMGKSAEGGFFFVLGGENNPDGAEGSTAGWTWRNINVTLEP